MPRRLWKTAQVWIAFESFWDFAGGNPFLCTASWVVKSPESSAGAPVTSGGWWFIDTGIVTSMRIASWDYHGKPIGQHIQTYLWVACRIPKTGRMMHKWWCVMTTVWNHVGHGLCYSNQLLILSIVVDHLLLLTN